MKKYWQDIRTAFATMAGGLKMTLRYFFQAGKSRQPIGVADPNYFESDTGLFTLQYPFESFPVPDNGRYRLHNEIDDCIVCDKCAKVCPVDCIEIDPIKATETFGTTSDGTPKRIYAAKFDIDMSKCCFCGLCTTVCPTECLTMTKVYDFSEFDVKDHVYSFADMSLTEIAEKRQAAAQAEQQKAASAAAKSQAPTTSPKPVFRPKPQVKPTTASTTEAPAAEISEKPKFRPRPVLKAKPVIKPEETKSEETPPSVKPKFKPKPMIKRKPKSDGDE